MRSPDGKRVATGRRHCRADVHGGDRRRGRRHAIWGRMEFSMPYVVAGMVLLGLVGATNLVLTFGVIKRLREHTALLSGGEPRRRPRMMVEAGESPGEFETTTLD